MTLYDFIKVANNDYDTYDNVFDGVITVCSFDEEDEQSGDYYEKFRIGIMRFVEVVDNSATHWGIVCKWTDMIKQNLRIFGEFAEKYWHENTYEAVKDDEDDFIYEWIEELQNWQAGALSESMYKEFVENYMSRMEAPV